MDVVKWVAGGAAGLLLIVGALYLAGFGGVVKVVQAVLGFFGDSAQSMRKWLQVPGNKIRGLCAVFAVCFLAAGLQSWQRGTVIIQQRQDYTNAQAEWGLKFRALQADIEARDATIKRFTDLAKQQMELLDQAGRENQQALESAEAARRRAAESEAKYQEAFNQKPPECAAALQVMAKACPTLQGY